MDTIFLTGLLGSLMLILGAAWPEKKAQKKPVESVKNWLFFVGGFVMLLYAVLGYLNGGPIFFVILEVLVAVASILMMIGTSDKVDVPVIGLSGLALIIWSFTLFEGINTVIFILGLTGVGLGYALDNGTLRRNVALTVGSFLIALFSFVEANWIFFYLNIFFAIFSGYWVLVFLRRSIKISRL